MEDLAERFRARFVEVARDRVRVALAGVAAVAAGDARAAPEVQSQLHTLAGEAGALGYPEIMELARRAEKSLNATAGCEALLREIERAVEALATRAPGKQRI